MRAFFCVCTGTRELTSETVEVKAYSRCVHERLWLEVVLEAGDMLYMPRGTVHQASCVPGSHSLHVTVSTNQFNTWADVLELAIPAALKAAVAEVPALRRCPPPDMLDHLGITAQNGEEEDDDDDGDDDDDEGAGRDVHWASTHTPHFQSRP